MNQMVCRPRSLPRDLWIQAARHATEENPANHPALDRLANVFKEALTHEFIAAVTTKYWRSGAVRLSVQFLDNPQAALRAKIISNMNAWGTRANVRFSETHGQGQVRIARQSGDDGGYWSYVGTDILQIPADQPTMNLERFSLETSESEFHRVVRHETGHTMGFPHEHMRRELVAKIDPDKALAYFMETQGWSEAEVRAQVLTPIEESSLIGTPNADGRSIMCYQIPGTITRDGQAIVGGLDIDEQDYAFAAKLYPRKHKQASRANHVDGEAGTDGPEPAGVLWFAPNTDPEYVASVIAALDRPS